MEDKTIEKVDFSMRNWKPIIMNVHLTNVTFQISLSEELYSKNVHSKSATFH